MHFSYGVVFQKPKGKIQFFFLISSFFQLICSRIVSNTLKVNLKLQGVALIGAVLFSLKLCFLRFIYGFLLSSYPSSSYWPNPLSTAKVCQKRDRFLVLKVDFKIQISREYFSPKTANHIFFEIQTTYRLK